QRGGQLFLVADGGDGLEVRLDRRKTLGLDGGLVHIRVVEIGDFARAGAGRPAAFGSLFNQGSGALVAQVSQSCKYTDAGAVWRNFRALDPFAVAVQIKVIARLDRTVHIADHNAVGILFWRVLRGGCKQGETKNSNKLKT